MGLTSLTASKYDMTSAAIGKKQMRILCVGHGGGSLPLFLANHILGKDTFHCTSYIYIYFTSLLLLFNLCFDHVFF